MQRGEIVFEKTSLVQQAQQTESAQGGDTGITFNDRSTGVQRNSLDSDNGGSTRSSQDVITEAHLRKKLPHMCFRPRRVIKPFLDEKHDMSLFKFLKNQAD